MQKKPKTSKFVIDDKVEWDEPSPDYEADSAEFIAAFEREAAQEEADSEDDEPLAVPDENLRMADTGLVSTDHRLTLNLLYAYV